MNKETNNIMEVKKMYTVANLKHYSVKELRIVAKEFNVKGRWDMTKPMLIDAILSEQNKRESEKQVSKTRYLKNIEVGVLVAYNSNDGMKSAKVLNVSQSEQKLKVVDIFGNIEIIDFGSVAWVKTGKRWPTNIYQMIKRHTWAKKIAKVCECSD
jgi:hypothetical protein